MTRFQAERRLLALFTVFLCAPLFSQSSNPIVENISAAGNEYGTITLSWTLPKGSYENVISFLIYRSPRPISSFSGTEDLTPVARLSRTSYSFTDIPPDTREYYYAVVTNVADEEAGEPNTAAPVDGSRIEGMYYDEELDASLATAPSRALPLVLPGVNATVIGARLIRVSTRGKVSALQEPPVVPEEGVPGDLRDVPLAIVNVLGDFPPESRPAPSAENEAMKREVESLLKPPAPKPLLDMYVFDEDLVQSYSGDDYVLFEVLKSSFIRQDFAESITALESYLSQNRTPSCNNRATFYLGESYYYTGSFPEALNCFLLVEDVYPELCREWIESSLDHFSPELN